MRWARIFLPDTIQCAQWRGSLWRGQCQGLSVNTGAAQPLQLPALQWRFHPSALFTLALQADVQAQLADGQASAILRLQSGGRIQLREFSAATGLDRGLLNMLPADLTGQLLIERATLGLKENTLLALEGRLQLRDIVDASGARYGSYQLDFAPVTAPPYVGKLVDTGGPLSVDAVLTIQPDRSWRIQGSVAARDAGDVNLNRRLDLIGSPDAAGRRALAAEGSFH
jgi:Type II secretion system (T2SS), protein N